MAGEDPTKSEPAAEPEPKGGPEPKADPEPKGAAEPDPEPDVRDSHGQPGINKERHDREVAELQAKIDALEAKAAEAAEQKAKRDEYEKEVADLRAELADSKVDHKLEMAGCVNAKAAKALLGDYGDDVAKLKEACPYLFGKEKQTGSTGAKPGGAPDKSEERRANARKAAAGSLTIKR